MRQLAAVLLLGGALMPAVAGHANAQETTAEATASDEVIATVNGVDITQKDIRMAIGDLASVLRQVPPEQQGDYIISFLIDIQLVSTKAEEDGLDDDETFKQQMEFFRNKALVQAKLREVGDAAISDEAVKARYDEAIKDFEAKEEVRARHILVKTEDEAKSLKSEIEGGASFEELATEHSTDGSSQKGGDLGYFTKDMMVEPFGETAFAMEVGTVSDPVQTQFGWHLIKLEDKRMSSPPPLEEVREEITRDLSQTARREYVQKLRAEADISRADGKPVQQ